MVTNLKKELIEFLESIQGLPKYTLTPIVAPVNSDLHNDKTLYYTPKSFGYEKESGFGYRIDFERVPKDLSDFFFSIPDITDYIDEQIASIPGFEVPNLDEVLTKGNETNKSIKTVSGSDVLELISGVLNLYKSSTPNENLYLNQSGITRMFPFSLRTYMFFLQNQIVVHGLDSAFRGLSGQNYYGDNYTSTSYIQKKYVDDNLPVNVIDVIENTSFLVLTAQRTFYNCNSSTVSLNIVNPTTHKGKEVIIKGNLTLGISGAPVSDKFKDLSGVEQTTISVVESATFISDGTFWQQIK